MTENPNGSISVRQMAKILRKLHVNNGDVVAVKYKSSVGSTKIVEDIVQALGRKNLKDVLVIVVDNFEDLQVLNETEMNKNGWFRLKSLAKTLRLPDKETKK